MFFIKKMLKYLFIKSKIKADNYIEIECNASKNLILLHFKDFLTIENREQMIKILEIGCKKAGMNNITIGIIEGVQLDKVVHITDYTFIGAKEIK